MTIAKNFSIPKRKEWVLYTHNDKSSPSQIRKNIYVISINIIIKSLNKINQNFIYIYLLPLYLNRINFRKESVATI